MTMGITWKIIEYVSFIGPNIGFLAKNRIWLRICRRRAWKQCRAMVIVEKRWTRHTIRAMKLFPSFLRFSSLYGTTKAFIMIFFIDISSILFAKCTYNHTDCMYMCLQRCHINFSKCRFQFNIFTLIYSQYSCARFIWPFVVVPIDGIGAKIH